MRDDLVHPTVHINGTSPDTLFRDLMEAINACAKFEDKLTATAPNPRDFYPQGPDAHAIAARQHAARLERVREVRRELIAIAERIEL